jgi:hypothetical protein
MKLRIVLKAKKDFGSILKHEHLIIINDVFCTKTGIAFFPIETEKWQIIRYDLFTGLKDIKGVEIFEKDGLKTKWSKHSEVDFYVKFIDGTFILVDDYENPSDFHHLFDNVDFQYEVFETAL